ncbi:uncharacterized protein N7500_008531 [Penicillium coprophilum]|uniref:uncharacterized protein n=1 Tax=Penicillium coprophilum TaxID=36646 RepID=UPI0023A43384|nr:uncharacterized protein N7500_008531 [Penicillium coprophilum]KAJ5158880.1 hypothetical protein N7500_008531 [Penicillium coprophilum]
MQDSIKTDLTTIHFAAGNLAKSPGLLDDDRSCLDRDVSYIPRHSHYSTAPMSPDSLSRKHQRERQRHRDHQKWQLLRDHEASRPCQQFDAQVDEMVTRIKEEIKNRTLVIPNGDTMDSLAYDRVKKDWVEQGIWNEEWYCTPSEQWMHEKPLEAVETDMVIGIHSSPSTGKNIQGGQGAKQKPGDESSRPFHQFIYQISRERERIESDYDFPGAAPVSAPTDIHTKAYENVKEIWIKRGIWNNQWGILPGLAWKHESPLHMLDNDYDLIPSPTKARGHVQLTTETRALVVDESFSVQADPSLGGAQGTSKRKRAASPVDTKISRRKVSRTVNPEPDPRPAVDNSSDQLDVSEQGTQDTGRRRSTRLRSRAK